MGEDTRGTAIKSFSLTLFGPMQALVEGQPLPAVRSRKALWLLALLTLREGRPVPREWLAGMLWPDTDQSQGFANLRTVLSELRRALGSQSHRLRAENRQAIALDLEDADVDVVAFGQAMEAGRFAEAVAIYRGPLLEGSQEEWVQQERTGREQECLRALQTLGALALSEGDFRGSADWYRKAIAIDPWWDAAYRGLMEALAKAGDRNEALLAYRGYEDRLRGESKSVPDEQTTALYLKLRAEARRQPRALAVVETEAAPAVTGHLPHPLTELIGREDERDEVIARLRRSRLVTLTGFGGIGKTRLAIGIAATMVEEFPGGVWMVALESLSNDRQVAQQIANVLGVKEESELPLLDSVVRHLRGKRLLLVLDNCEHILEGATEVIGHLLRECAAIRILTTSRENLGITGEATWSVPPLATPDPAHLPAGKSTIVRVLPGYESVQLFIERARSASAEFALSPDNAATVAQICFRLEGIPLAIELAAARVKAMTVEQIAERLDNHLGLLTGGSRIAQPRQQTLRLTLDWSFELLSNAERTLLRRLSVFASGWTLEAAELVCSEDGIEGDGIADLLTSLVDKSLVLFENRNARYRLLEMVRQYGDEELRKHGEADAFKIRHRDYFVTLAEDLGTKFAGPEAEDASKRATDEYSNLRLIMGSSDTGRADVEAGLRVSGALWRYWYSRGELVEGEKQLRQAFSRDQEGPGSLARANVLHGWGVMLYCQGDFAGAKEKHEIALEIRQRLDDTDGIAASIFNLGNVAAMTGDPGDARRRYQESLELWRKLGNQRSVALLLANLGRIALVESDIVLAKGYFEQSIVALKEIGDRRGMAWALNDLGNVALDMGEYVAAGAYYEECMSVFVEIGERRGVGWTLYKFGVIALISNDLDAANAKFEEARAIFSEVREKRGLVWTLCGIWDLAVRLGQYDSAESNFEEIHGLFEELGEKRGHAHLAMKRAKIAHARNELRQGKALIEEALPILCEVNDRAGIAEAFDILAALLLDLAHPETATCLLSCAEAMRVQLSTHYHPFDRAEHDRRVRQARHALGDEVFDALWSKGQAMSWEEGWDLAVSA